MQFAPNWCIIIIVRKAMGASSETAGRQEVIMKNKNYRVKYTKDNYLYFDTLEEVLNYYYCIIKNYKNDENLLKLELEYDIEVYRNDNWTKIEY